MDDRGEQWRTELPKREYPMHRDCTEVNEQNDGQHDSWKRKLLIPSDPDTRAQTHPRDFPSPCYGVGEALLGLRQVCGHSTCYEMAQAEFRQVAGIFRPLHLPFHLLVKMIFIKRFPATSSRTAASCQTH